MCKKGYLTSLFLFVFLTCSISAINYSPSSAQEKTTNTKAVSAVIQFVDISTGESHSLAVASDGSLWAWGANESGQLGDGTFMDRNTPVKIGTGTDWKKVSAGKDHSLAMKKDGTLWAWGGNSTGQLGTGAPGARVTPGLIVSMDDILMFDAGSNNSVLVKSDGTLWVWGEGKYVPERLGSENDWAYASSGILHSVAVKKDGSIWYWLNNVEIHKIVGDIVPEDNSPELINKGTQWQKAEAGDRFFVTQKNDGSLWLWDMDKNQVSSSPVSLSSSKDWKSFSAGGALYATAGDGSLWLCGGAETNGHPVLAQMDSRTFRRFDKSSGWSVVSVGTNHVIALKTDGSLWSWGSNTYGQLGGGYGGTITSPVSVDNSKDWKDVSGSNSMALALKSNGTLWGWGFNYEHGVNTSDILKISSPTQIGKDRDWVDIRTSDSSFGLKKDGSLWSWGMNYFGGVNNSRQPVKTQQRIGTDKWIAIRSSYNTVGLKQDGTIWSWGYDPKIRNAFMDSAQSKGKPVQLGKDNDWVGIFQGNDYLSDTVFAIKKDGSLWGIGSNICGQLCDGTRDYSDRFKMIGNDKDWLDVAASGKNVYALKKDGSLWAWGELYTYISSKMQPRKISNEKWSKISLEWNNLLAIRQDGTLWGLGFNTWGEVGDGTRLFRTQLVQIGKDKGWIGICAGNGGSFGIKKDGSLWYWGINPYFDLSVKTTPYRLNPGKLTMTGTTATGAEPSPSNVEKQPEVVSPALETQNSPVNPSPSAPSVKEITVSTAKEFVEALGSNRKIILKPGVYDLSSISQKDKEDGTVTWKNVSDGKELNLSGITDLTIEGSGRDKTEIRVTPRYANVLCFNGCSGISVRNLKAGHKPEEYMCNAGVISFENSSNISVSGLYLYGCGSMGIYLNKSMDVVAENTVITQCSLTAVSINNSTNVSLKGCELVKNDAYMDIVRIYFSNGVTLSGCTISGNNSLKHALFYLLDSDAVVDSCKIIGNSTVSGYIDKTYFIDGYDNGRNQITFKNTEITGNSFDLLQSGSVLSSFENCSIGKNSFVVTDPDTT